MADLTEVTVRAAAHVEHWPVGSIHTVVLTPVIQRLLDDGHLELVTPLEQP